MDIEQAVKEARRRTFQANRHLGVSPARRAAAEAERRTRDAWAPPVPIVARVMLWFRPTRRYVAVGETIWVKPSIAEASIKQGYFRAGQGKPPADREAPPILILGDTPRRDVAPGWASEGWVRLPWGRVFRSGS